MARVLLVDGGSDILKPVERRVATAEHRVLAAGPACEALALVAQRGGRMSASWASGCLACPARSCCSGCGS